MEGENVDMPEVPVEVPPVIEEAPKEDTKVAELEAHNKQLFERTKKAEADAKASKAQVDMLRKSTNGSLDIEDYIDISSSLDGLDSREKEYLAKQHKLTGQPLQEIRKSEDFQFWDSAYKSKIEKEKALTPSSTQTITDAPMSFEQKLESATTMADKEKLLVEAGLMKPQKNRGDNIAHIGTQR